MHLSTAADIVDYDVLNRLEHWFRIFSLVVSWFASYLHSPTHEVSSYQSVDLNANCPERA